jgi:DNA polymerase IIIc chi subunit
VVNGKREAFLRLAEKRTNAVMEKIRVLSNCSNPHAYEYDEEDVRRIFAAIDKELKAARARFMNHRKREFRLGDRQNG